MYEFIDASSNFRSLDFALDLAVRKIPFVDKELAFREVRCLLRNV